VPREFDGSSCATFSFEGSEIKFYCRDSRGEHSVRQRVLAWLILRFGSAESWLELGLRVSD
jgi:hypothetical protein